MFVLLYIFDTVHFLQKIAAKSNNLGVGNTNSAKKEEDNLLWRFYPTGTLHSVYHKDFLEWKEKMIKIASS